MSFHKYQADGVFTGKELLPADHVLILDIEGKVEAIVPATEAGEDVQSFEGVLSPGFINCHCHLELSHMKGLIPERTGLIDFVFSVVSQRHLPPEEIAEAIEMAELSMIENGIVAVGDICNNLDTLHQKKKRRLAYYNFVESSGWLPDIAEARFSRSKAFHQEFVDLQLVSSIVPHAPYSVSDELWQRIQPYFSKKVVSIHNQETSFEDELFIQGTGDFVRMYEMMKLDNSFFRASKKSSLQTYFENLSGADSVILVHNTFTTAADIAFAKQISSKHQQLLSFCLCVNANLYIENQLPKVDLFMQDDCNIVLGTDSLASNWSLSILDEMKTLHQHFPSIPFVEMLRWATSNGAAALQMDETLGSFEKGKKPGVVIIQHLENNHLTSNSTAQRVI